MCTRLYYIEFKEIRTSLNVFTSQIEQQKDNKSLKVYRGELASTFQTISKVGPMRNKRSRGTGLNTYINI